MMDMIPGGATSLSDQLAVVPVLIGPLQVLIAILPGLLLSLATAIFALFKPSTFLSLLRLIWRLKLPLGVGVGVLVAGCYGLRALLPDRGAAVGAAETGDHLFAAFRGDLDRRGWVPGHPDPVEPGIRWTFDQGHKTFYGSPAVVGNRLYIASSEVTLFNPMGRSELYCLDADTGGLVWSGGPPDYRATFSSAAVGERHIAIGEGLHLTKDSRLTVMDRDTGAVLWTYRSNSHMESTPAIGDGRVVVGAGQDGFYCFALDPDENGEPVLLWHAPGPADYPDASGSPAIYEGRAYLPLGRWGGRALACLDLETGEELWRTAMPYPVFSGPTFAHGRVYVGMGNGNFIQSAEQALPGELDRLREAGLSEDEVEAARETLLPGGAVWSLDPETGDEIWRHDLPRTVLGQVVVNDEAVFAATRDGHLYRIDLDGRRVGSWQSGAPIVASPALAENHIYVLNENGRLACLETERLRVVWETMLGSGWPWIGSPTVARGMVYVGTLGAGVVAVGRPGGEAPPPIWSGHAGGAGIGGRLDDEGIGQRGVMRWRFTGPEDHALRSTAPAARLDGRTYLPSSSADRPGLYCLAHGRDETEAPEPAWFFATANPVHRSPAASVDQVLVVDGAPGDDGRYLHALDPQTGSLRWQRPALSTASGALRLDHRGILAALSDDGLVAFDHDGQELWTAPIGRVVYDPAAEDSLVAVALQEPAALAVLDRFSGAELLRTSLSGQPRAGPVIHRDTVIIDDGSDLLSIGFYDAVERWRISGLRLGGGSVALARGRLAVVSDDGRLLVIDAGSGEVIRQRDDALSSVPPLLLRDELLYYNQAGNWMRLAIDDDEDVRWLAARWLGAPTAPAIASGGSLYYATAERGFIRIGRRE